MYIKTFISTMIIFLFLSDAIFAQNKTGSNSESESIECIVQRISGNKYFLQVVSESRISKGNQYKIHQKSEEISSAQAKVFGIIEIHDASENIITCFLRETYHDKEIEVGDILILRWMDGAAIRNSQRGRFFFDIGGGKPVYFKKQLSNSYYSYDGFEDVKIGGSELRNHSEYSLGISLSKYFDLYLTHTLTWVFGENRSAYQGNSSDIEVNHGVSLNSRYNFTPDSEYTPYIRLGAWTPLMEYSEGNIGYGMRFGGGISRKIASFVSANFEIESLIAFDGGHPSRLHFTAFSSWTIASW